MSIGSELLAIKQANSENMVVPEEVHEWAEAHPQSDLHRSLEWDNEAAGYQHRLTQIRRLVQIHLVHSDEKPTVISLSTDRVRPGGGYRDMDEVLSKKELFDVALADALAELERVQNRYNRLHALQPVWKAVAQVRRTQGRRQRRRGGEDRATA